MIRSNNSLRLPQPAGFKRAKTMGIFLGLLTLLLHVVPGVVDSARAQGSRKDDVVYNSRGVPLAGATVRVCTMPASGQPCTPLANIYSDSALTQAVANPTTTDGLGNYHFYAAPGRYMIEISGPSITTRQIPDVLLPADPTSPTFTGNVSAFSLNLAGNLTVNGNTSVIGNLASGTLNLADQSVTPGAANTGTVNLYTKSDKRLYYMDDTGTEIGPIASASGAQTNISNTFTAAQNVDADLHIKGPNPEIDLSRYGAYYSTLPMPQTTGGIGSGGTTLTLASAQDFANGQGLVVYGAGPLPTISTPPTPTVTPTGILNGTTTYSYQVIAEDYYGGLTAASAAGSTSVGAANLGVTQVTLASASRANGVNTYTSTVNHNLQSGIPVAICQFTGGTGCPGSPNDTFNGIFVIASTPSGTTFTTDTASTYPATTETSGTPYAEVLACNKLSFSSYSGTGTLRYWIYRSKNGGAYSLAGVAQGLDPYFVDCGVSTPTAPGYVPSTPPSSTQARYLSTTIVSGGGTTALTLAASASTTVSGATVLHDNTPALLAASQAALNNGGATVYIGASSASPSITYYPFSSTFDSTTLTNTGGYPLHIVVNAYLGINQSWILSPNIDIDGLPKQGSSFNYVPGGSIGGGAFPIFYIPRGGAFHLNRLQMNLTSAQQSAIYADEDTLGDGATGLIADQLSVKGFAGSSRPIVLKGGYDFRFDSGVCDANNAQVLTTPYCVDLMTSSSAVTGSNAAQIPGRVDFDNFYFVGTGIHIFSIANNTSAASTYNFSNSLFEVAFTPFLKIDNTNILDEVHFANVVGADSTGQGAAMPFVDSTNGGLRNISWEDGGLSSSTTPIVISSNITSADLTSVTNLVVKHSPSFNIGNVPWFNMDRTRVEANDEVISALNGGALIYRIPDPGAAPSVSVTSGGSVPLGTYNIAYSLVDASGRETKVSPSISATTTSGNQTIVVTPPSLGNGAVGWYPYQNGARMLISGLTGSCNSPISVTIASYSDTSNTICGASTSSISSAGSSSMDVNGVSSWKYTLGTNSITAPAGAAGKTWTFADHNTQFAPATAKPSANIGFTIETGIAQSVFDNFNRANGAIGLNWTVQNGGLNVSSNAIVGTGSTSNWAFFSAAVAAFTSDQFAEISLPASIPAGGGAGPAVRASGTGSSADNYNCHPNNTTLYLEKILNGASTILSSIGNTTAAGDVIRLEVSGNTINCYYNGVLKLTATDNSLTTGSPGLETYNTSATLDNWTGGNLVPLAHTGLEQDFSQVQHFPFGITVGPLSLASAPPAGITMGAESFNSVPRAVIPAFLPGALTSTWTGSTITLDKAITVTRVQVQAKTAPSACSTNAIVRLTDGTTNQDVTINAAANDSGAIAKNYAAGASLTVSVQTAAAGCATAPADANVIVQFKMQ
ncbi:MAG TPA: hypothetical protein VLV88_13215 [Terriglobales bacterium]|nr:hypothetical protein [Terriglobales bacterium]